MSRLVFAGDRVAEFVARGLGAPVVPPYTAFGVESAAGNMVAGAVFNQHTGANIEVSVYAPGALRRGFIRAIMHYAFVQLGCCRLTARTRRGNRAMRTILPKMGFGYEGTMRRFYGPTRSDDAFMFGLMRENAERWLR